MRLLIWTHGINRLLDTTHRVARLLGYAFLVSAIVLIVYTLVSGRSDDLTVVQLAYVAIVSGASLTISRTGPVSLGITVLVVGIEALLFVEPYFLLHDIHELTTFLFISMMGLMILIAEREAESARGAAEEAKARLEEKTTLLREVYRRVKNNLQVVISLLSLQASQTSDEGAKNALQAVRGRVSAMALVHQTLHNSSTLSSVDARSFIRGLVDAAEDLHAELRKVETTLDVDPVIIDISKLVSLGLIINELSSNAYEHAFSAGVPGRIDLSLRNFGDGTVTLDFADDGAGLRHGFDPSTAASLGMTLVYQLAQQLNGTLSVRTVPEVSGTRWSLTLPI